MGRRSVALAVALGFVAACTGGGPPKPTGILPASPSPSPRRGGEAIFGAEQWPECLNPITSCASATWTHYSVLQHVLPRAMQFDVNGNVVASPLLAEAPTLENGGLRQSPFTVAFHISPAAVWDDGSPITSEDFRFTWLAQLNTRGAYASYEERDYDEIRSVDASDPREAILRFRDVYVDWPDLFGGLDQYLLKAAAFPEADPNHPDLSKEMENEIPFSGGPFTLESWDQNKAVFVRNDRYFGPRAYLYKVTFLSLLDQTRELLALREGQVSAIFPFPPMGSPDATLADWSMMPHVRTLAGDGLYFEALWLNHSIAPLDDPRVREALMYAIDRQAVIDRIVKPWNPKADVLNCGFVAFPDIGPWCETRPFERYRYDPARSRAILEADGYTCVAAPCTKNSKTLQIEYLVVSTNVRRTATQRLLVHRALAAGFGLVPRNIGSTGYFGFPFFGMADYAQGGEVDPSVTEYFACNDFRTRSHPEGRNWNNWCDPAADRLMREADRELDPNRRADLMNLVYQLEAFDSLSLPLYVVPAVSAWRTDKIAGPVGAWNSSPYGLFFNMEEWYLAS
jgi:peptide/nickel transport system substrate-binding protein